MDSTRARATGAPHSRTGGRLVRGALAGLLAAAAMVLFMVLAALVDDRPIEMALRPLVAYSDAEGAAAFVLGAVELAIASALLGYLLGVLLPNDLALGGSAVVGTAYGLAVMSILTSVADELRSTMAPLGGSWVIASGIFGAVLGAAPALLRRRRQRRLARRAAPAAAAHPAGGEAPA